MPFKKERQLWFGEKNEVFKKVSKNRAQHPDDNEEVVMAIKRRRGPGVDSMFKNKVLIPRHPVDASCLQKERFPQRTFFKKPLSMCLATTSSNDTVDK